MIPNIRKTCQLKSKSNRLMSCLSISTICLLITASIVIMTIISITPIIILSLGQISVGQRDLILTPILDYINATKIQQLSGERVLPRLRTQIKVAGKQQGKGWFMDLNGQNDSHLGTIGGNEPSNHTNVYLHSAYQIKQGEQVIIQLQSRSFLNIVLQQIQSSKIPQFSKIAKQIISLDNKIIQGKFIVKQIFSDAKGKFPIGQVNRYAYLDINIAFQQMINYTYVKLNKNKQKSPLIHYINSLDFHLSDYASQVTINIPNRVEVYSNSDYQKTYDDLSYFAAQIKNKIGLFSVQSAMPIADNLIVIGYFGMFIGVVLKLIIFSLFILSAIMMNNMLTLGVETKQFYLALFKTLGANKLFLAIYVLFDALKLVLISNFIAFLFSYCILRMMTTIFESFFGFRYQIQPTRGSVIGGLIIGILVPLVSSIIPMKDIFNNNLVQHLNPIRNKTQAIHTEIYVEGKQFPYGKIIFGMLATLFGLMIIYFLPKGLVNQDISLLLVVFIIILAGLLIGMVLIGFSSQYLLQRVIAYVFLFWMNSTDFMLMLKNLSSHRFKNRRSCILYAFSVAFIVFVTVGLQIQVQTTYNQLLKTHGSFMQINGISLDRQYYDDLLSKTEGVQDWAYLTIALHDYVRIFHNVSKVLISDEAKLYFVENYLVAVSPNIINTWYSQKINIDRTESKSPYNPYSYLYTIDGHNTSTLSNFVAKKFNIYEGQNKQFLVNYYWPDKILRVPLNYSTVFSKYAVLAYSAFSKYTQIGVSMDKFKQLAGVPKYKQIPLNRLRIKLKNLEDCQKIAEIIEKKIPSNSMDSLWHYSELNSTISHVQNLLSDISNILLVVVLIISFFSLVTTSYINIVNQTVQIGILLTLGYQKSRIIRIYIFQTFILVVNSCIIGIVVGWLLAWMMAIQRQLFADYTIGIQISGLYIIVSAAILSSVLSTYKPLKQIFSNSITQILNYS